MSKNQLRTRLQRLFTGENGRTTATSSARTSIGRRPASPSNKTTTFVVQSNSTGLDMARFGLFTLATLPFTSWLALYTYEYWYRVEFCRRALGSHKHRALVPSQPNPSLSKLSRVVQKSSQIQGKNPILLSNDTTTQPQKLIFIAGSDPTVKTFFLNSLLSDGKQQDNQHGIVVYIPVFDDSIPSISSSTTVGSRVIKAIINAFDLQWLRSRSALVDSLPSFFLFSFWGSSSNGAVGSSERDLTQALDVITQALEQTAAERLTSPTTRTRGPSPTYSTIPVIILDGFMDDSSNNNNHNNNSNSRAIMQQLLVQWCVNTMADERGLAHFVLMGTEEWVIRSMMTMEEQQHPTATLTRGTRGNVHVVGSSSTARTLEDADVSPLVLKEWPDARPNEIQKLIEVFGRSIPDLQTSSQIIHQYLTSLSSRGSAYPQDQRAGEGDNNAPDTRRAEIVDRVLSSRFRIQVEKVIAALGRGQAKDTSQCSDKQKSYGNDGDEGMVASAQVDDVLRRSDRLNNKVSWSRLQLWRTLVRLVESEEKTGVMEVSFHDLRENVFDGDATPLVELMKYDLLGFDVSPAWPRSISGGSVSISNTSLAATDSRTWRVTPATPTVHRIFKYLVRNNQLRQHFQDVERLNEVGRKLVLQERDYHQLRLERDRLDMRKSSLLKTVELGTALEMSRERLSQSTTDSYDMIVAEDIAMEKRELKLRSERQVLLQEGERHQRSKIIPIEDLLRAAIEDTCAQEDVRVLKAQQLVEQKALSKSRGLTASDIIRLIKERTGEVMDVATAESFIRAWDSNQDKRLDYDEFIEMLLTEATSTQRKKTPKQKRKTVAGGGEALKKTPNAVSTREEPSH